MSVSNQVVLVYTMGKVGSMTIYETLKNKLQNWDVYHVHFLSKEYLEEVLPGEDKSFHHNIAHGYEIRNQLEKYKKIHIITLVRDPIARDISDIFQNWGARFDKSIESGVDFNYLHNWFNELNHHYVLNWFNIEFEKFTGFDIYSKKFSKRKGYSINNFGRFKILVMKLESLNKSYQKAFRNFLKFELTDLENVNLSIDKHRNKLYKELSENYKATSEKMDLIYNSQLVKHFYTRREIKDFMKKWQ